eukprot:359756-Rhodomonas_salina.2
MDGLAYQRRDGRGDSGQSMDGLAQSTELRLSSTDRAPGQRRVDGLAQRWEGCMEHRRASTAHRA